MVMAKKDYVAISNIIKKTKPMNFEANANPVESVISSITLELTHYFATTNPAFDCMKFYQACGYFAGRDT